MKVLVACEFSGVVRDAFAARGHDAWSLDFVPSERRGQHLLGTILDCQVIKKGWDLMIAHPDCTFLTVSGARHFNVPWRQHAQLSAFYFVKALWEFPIPRIAVENPVGVLSTMWRKPSQIIQPYEYGDNETKKTCLWLKGLPKLVPTDMIEGPHGTSVWSHAPGPERKKNRSRTFQGIADAMADQWGNPEPFIGNPPAPKGQSIGINCVTISDSDGAITGR